MVASKDIMRNEVRLPYRSFMYTIDQVCYMLDVEEKLFMSRYVYYSDRDVGKPRDRLVAVNIASPDEKPDWRVSEESYIAWLKGMGIKIVEIRKPVRRVKRHKIVSKEAG